MVQWRLTWTLVIIVILGIDYTLGQLGEHSAPRATNHTRDGFHKRRAFRASDGMPVAPRVTGTGGRPHANRSYSDYTHRAAGSKTSRGRVQELFNFECGNRFEPPEGERRRIKRFIAGGYEAGQYSYPSYMKIMVGVGGLMFNKCGGTLISRMHIITATHCFPNGHGDVFAESTIYQRPSPSRLPVEKVCHLGVPQSDITILRLARPVIFSPTCQPACLPHTPLTSSMHAITVGLGANHIPSWNTNQVRNPDELQALPVRRVGCKWGDNDKAHICFRPSMKEFTGASCKGDSGGPTYAAIDGKQTVYSVVSYGSDHICEAGRAGYSVNGDIYHLRNPIINLMMRC